MEPPIGDDSWREEPGWEAARAEAVLLVDARVTVPPESFLFIEQQRAHHPDRRLWNADVHVDTSKNPYAAFWQVLVRLGFWRYFAKRQLTSFGLREFERYPKGTGCFLAPADWLRVAMSRYEPDVADVKLSSDDTRLLRLLAENSDIYISPDFTCHYKAREDFGGFLRHAYFRGTTFVDGYLRSDGHVGRAFGFSWPRLQPSP